MLTLYPLTVSTKDKDNTFVLVYTIFVVLKYYKMLDFKLKNIENTNCTHQSKVDFKFRNK